ncbi:MAG: (2Fe-2S)-binding protein [Lachnospiraceae bacterium]|nr:(2Fe-2S)-binding protein [Candidatus Equihabitans merdae]
MAVININLNGEDVSCHVENTTRLVDLLRDQFNLCGTKEGCGQGECGACTILMDDEAVHACLVLAMQANGHRILTIEGLAKEGELDVIQQAFLDAGAIQCGFCTPGMVMSAKGLLIKNPTPTEEEIREALEGNICRCTGYVKIVEAVKLAAERMAASC